ncbi:MAG: SdpI family protein [Oscillospiraceae bacterium]|nr:SdpI family protein [Oscillospiraceae bacterium]
MKLVLSLFSTLFISGSMLFWGWWMRYHPPEEPGPIGYRTARACAGREPWAYANKCAGRCWILTGAVSLPAALVVLLWAMRLGDRFYTVFQIVFWCHITAMLLVIPYTEIHLRKKFPK